MFTPINGPPRLLHSAQLQPSVLRRCRCLRSGRCYRRRSAGV